jgi:hypothetical protein
MINLGEMELGSLTVAVIRDWYAAAIRTTDRRAAARATVAERRQQERVHAARSWALDKGLRVSSTRRLPAAVLREWEAAGRPGPSEVAASVHRSTAWVNPPGRARVAQAYRYLKTVLQQAVHDVRIDRCHALGRATFARSATIATARNREYKRASTSDPPIIHSPG